MPDLNHLLQEIDRLDQQATKGPWHTAPGVETQSGWFDGQVYAEHDGENVTGEISDKDAEFTALARTALPQLAKALQAVMDLEDESLDGDLQGYEIDQYIGHNQALQSVREAITDALGADRE